MRSLVMSDLETNTEWAHLLGQAMKGELKGKTLKPLITDMVTWGAWREEFPNTTVLDMSRTAREFRSDFYGSLKNFVFGFVVKGNAYALRLDKLAANPVHNFEVEGEKLLATYNAEATATHLFDPMVDEQHLTFAAIDEKTMKDTETESIWNLKTGQALSGPLKGKLLEQRVGIMSFEIAWSNFHPNSKDVFP